MSKAALIHFGIWALLWAPLARAEPSPDENESAPTSQPAIPDAERSAARAAVAQILNPGQYPPAFNLGAEAEFIGTTFGVASLRFGYDATFMQVEVGLGMGFGGDPFGDVDANDVYSTRLTVAFPVHRGIRADFAVAGAGGVTFVDPTTGGNFRVGSLSLGARIRSFVSPNLALLANLGAAALFRGDNSAFGIGARPLGGAAIVYYFR